MESPRRRVGEPDGRRRPFAASVAAVLARRSGDRCADDPTVPGGMAELDRWWERLLPGWHLLYLGLLALAIVTNAVNPRLDLEQRWAMVGLLTTMAIAYITIGRHLFGEPGGARAGVYLTITWLSFYGAIYVSGGHTNAFFLLFALFPQVWAYLAPRVASATSVVVISGFAVTEIHLSGWSWDTVTRTAPQVVMQTGLVLLMGLLMVGMVREAERRATLIDELAAARSELADTERARGVLAERERLANEIHDTLAQGFTSILTLSQAIEAALERDPDAVRERLALLERTARDNLAETRALVHALAPVDLQDTNVLTAIRRVAARFTEETGVPAGVDVQGEPVPLPMFAEIVLLRAVQESLTNVRKHAGAAHVQITLSFVPTGHGLVSVAIADDGRGFDPDSAQGFGLPGMRARAQQAGGGFEVVSAPGSGTTVRVHVPMTTGEER